MRSTEDDIAGAAAAYLATVPHGEATIKAIKANLPKFHRLTTDDYAPSLTRRNEAVWEQQVRNIVSHRTSPGNYIADGLLSRRPGRLALTPLGKRRLSRKP